MKFVTTRDGHVLGTFSFTGGFTPAERTGLRRLTEEEATCHAAWLEKHLGFEEAFEFIDKWHEGHLFEVP